MIVLVVQDSSRTTIDTHDVMSSIRGGSTLLYGVGSHAYKSSHVNRDTGGQEGFKRLMLKYTFSSITPFSEVLNQTRI